MSTSPGSRIAVLIAAAAIALPAGAQYPPPPDAAPPPPAYAPPPPAYAPPPPAYAPPPPAYAPPPPAYQPQMQDGRGRGGVELSAFGGWQFNGDVSTYAGKLIIDDAASYGAALDFKVARGATAQLLYIYNSTSARFSSYNFAYPSSQKFNVDAHYMQIGGTRGIRRGKVETYGASSLGVVLVVPGNITYANAPTVSPGDVWRFAVTLGGGVKIWATEKVGIKLEGRLLVPMYFSGGGIYVGTGGSGMAVSAGVPALQGLFTAGLVLAP